MTKATEKKISNKEVYQVVRKDDDGNVDVLYLIPGFGSYLTIDHIATLCSTQKEARKKQIDRIEMSLAPLWRYEIIGARTGSIKSIIWFKENEKKNYSTIANKIFDAFFKVIKAN